MVQPVIPDANKALPCKPVLRSVTSPQNVNRTVYDGNDLRAHVLDTSYPPLQPSIRASPASSASTPDGGVKLSISPYKEFVKARDPRNLDITVTTHVTHAKSISSAAPSKDWDRLSNSSKAPAALNSAHTGAQRRSYSQHKKPTPPLVKQTNTSRLRAIMNGRSPSLTNLHVQKRQAGAASRAARPGSSNSPSGFEVPEMGEKRHSATACDQYHNEICVDRRGCKRAATPMNLSRNLDGSSSRVSRYGIRTTISSDADEYLSPLPGPACETRRPRKPSTEGHLSARLVPASTCNGSRRQGVEDEVVLADHNASSIVTASSPPSKIEGRGERSGEGVRSCSDSKIAMPLRSLCKYTPTKALSDQQASRKQVAAPLFSPASSLSTNWSTPLQHSSMTKGLGSVKRIAIASRRGSPASSTVSCATVVRHTTRHQISRKSSGNARPQAETVASRSRRSATLATLKQGVRRVKQAVLSTKAVYTAQVVASKLQPNKGEDTKTTRGTTCAASEHAIQQARSSTERTTVVKVDPTGRAAVRSRFLEAISRSSSPQKELRGNQRSGPSHILEAPQTTNQAHSLCKDDDSGRVTQPYLPSAADSLSSLGPGRALRCNRASVSGSMSDRGKNVMRSKSSHRIATERSSTRTQMMLLSDPALNPAVTLSTPRKPFAGRHLDISSATISSEKRDDLKPACTSSGSSIRSVSGGSVRSVLAQLALDAKQILADERDGYAKDDLSGPCISGMACMIDKITTVVDDKTFCAGNPEALLLMERSLLLVGHKLLSARRAEIGLLEAQQRISRKLVMQYKESKKVVDELFDVISRC